MKNVSGNNVELLIVMIELLLFLPSVTQPKANACEASKGASSFGGIANFFFFFLGDGRLGEPCNLQGATYKSVEEEGCEI